jgi:hypothetical protein
MQAWGVLEQVAVPVRFRLFRRRAIDGFAPTRTEAIAVLLHSHLEVKHASRLVPLLVMNFAVPGTAQTTEYTLKAEMRSGKVEQIRSDMWFAVAEGCLGTVRSYLDHILNLNFGSVNRCHSWIPAAPFDEYKCCFLVQSQYAFSNIATSQSLPLAPCPPCPP